MDRHRGERYVDYSDSHRNTHHAMPSWPSDDSVSHRDRNFDNHRGGFSGDNGYHNNHHHHEHRRPQNQYHNSHNLDHRHHHNSNSEPNDSVGGGGDGNSSQPHSHSGRKRQFSHSGASPECMDGGNIVKLYVGNVPRTAMEKDIRSVFGEYGNIVEVIFVKDKITGQQQEFCFVKYETLLQADRAIGALHNKYCFTGGVVPIKVKCAEGERERLVGWGTHVHKLYVGCLNKQALQRDIEEIFSPYGVVEDIYIVRDEMKQQRGCAFVQFSQRDMAIAAINALHGTYAMRGCDQPLIVRFADPKKPKVGESRGNSRYGSPGFGPCSQESFVRPAPFLSDPIDRHVLPNDTHPASPKRVVSSSRPPQTGSKPHIVSNTCTTMESALSTSSASVVASSTDTTDSLYCVWSEHFCPDGCEYYYNCVTCESRWEKPEEYAAYEQKLQKQQRRQPSPFQPLHSPSHTQVFSTQQVSEIQKVQLQAQLSHQQLQQPYLSSLDLDHMHASAATSPLVASASV